MKGGEDDPAHRQDLCGEGKDGAFDEVGSKGKLNIIVASQIEQDNFVKKYLPCLVVPV